jgi:hypothetical protein
MCRATVLSRWAGDAALRLDSESWNSNWPWYPVVVVVTPGRRATVGATDVLNPPPDPPMT